jgi:hypothetical protein
MQANKTTPKNNRSLGANTRAGRRNGSFKRSERAVGHFRDQNKGRAEARQRAQQERANRRPDRRIYTVLVSTRNGTQIYKVWERNDQDMGEHFLNAPQRYFSITDIRGKEIRNIDRTSGWRYKMSLRWNPEKVADDGSKGDWQNLREWHEERNDNFQQRKEQRQAEWEAQGEIPHDLKQYDPNMSSSREHPTYGDFKVGTTRNDISSPDNHQDFPALSLSSHLDNTEDGELETKGPTPEDVSQKIISEKPTLQRFDSADHAMESQREKRIQQLQKQQQQLTELLAVAR